MASSMRPFGRKAPGVLVEEIGDEFVVVDPATHEAHVLSGEAAEAWRAAEVVSAGMSRRELLRRAGTVAVAGSVITIAMPEVMAAASTIPPVGTTAFLEPDQTVTLGQQFTLTATVLADDQSIPTGNVTVTDPDHVSGPNGTTLPLANGQASFTFTAPATMPTTNPDVFSMTYVPTGNYTTSTDTATVTFVSGQITKTAPTITFSAPNTNNKAVWTLTVTVTGSGGHAPTGTIALTGSSSKGAVTVTPSSKTLTTGANSASTATFTVTNPSVNKPRTISLKATYTPASGDLYYNGTSKSTSYVSS